MGKNGRTGRPRQPTALKVARGTHRKDRDGDPAAEPAPAKLSKMPEPPAELSRVGKAAWRKHGKQLLECGLMTAVDLLKFRMLCASLDEEAECRKTLEGVPHYATLETGRTVPHPAIPRLHAVMGRIRQLAGDFGMSVSDRSGLHVDLGKKTKGVARRSRA